MEQVKKRIFIQTWGCQMNEYDTELVRSILREAGFGFALGIEDADVIMLNTCAVRENAYRKVYGYIHEIRHQRASAENGSPAKPFRIGILGCMATNLRHELLEDRKLNIDFIAGPDSYKRLPQLIKECYATDVGTEHCSVRTGKPYDVTLSEFETYADVYPSRQEGVNAWIAIMRGCNNFCTFCVVPYTRGRERSRPAANILDEVRRLVGEGFKQVTLLGQNVNSYHDGTNDFADLIEQVSQMEGIRRVRFTSPHPKDFPDKLLEVMRQNPKICKHIHLPLQAGNNRILDMMNRSYTRDEFLALVHKIREFCPGIALSTDVIVGFPTETNAEFTDTLSVMREVEFDSAFMFKYSERKGTTASKKYKDDVSEEDKARRIIELNDLQKDISLKKNRAHIGETFDVLVNHERPAKLPDQWQGRTDGNKLVIFKSDPVVPGDLIPVQITDATPHALKGESAI